MKLIIISGRSGSGKSIVLRSLEDLGYYCVDNIPVNLLLTADTIGNDMNIVALFQEIKAGLLKTNVSLDAND